MAESEQKPRKIGMQLQRHIKITKLNHFGQRVRQFFADQPPKPYQKVLHVWPYEICTKKRMAKTIYNNAGAGHYNVCFNSNKKNRYGRSYVKRAEIIVLPVFDDDGRLNRDKCNYEWITQGKPTTKNRSGHVDRMYMLRWFWRDDD